jgi:hypothetical protein
MTKIKEKSGLRVYLGGIFFNQNLKRERTCQALNSALCVDRYMLNVLLIKKRNKEEREVME